MPDYSSDLFFLFSSDYNPHTERSTFLTILTISKSHNSSLANLKYWRKSLRSSIFTSSKKLKGTKGYSLRKIFGAVRLFFRKKKHFPQRVPLQFFLSFPTERMLKNPKGSPLVRQFGSTFGLFLYRRRKYFDTLKSFCCF